MGIIAVSSGAWGETFEKQIGRSSCGLAIALAYTRQVCLMTLAGLDYRIVSSPKCLIWHNIFAYVYILKHLVLLTVSVT